ncbi:MAG: DUF6400 family protein [Pseudonocardiales bacterium]
MAATTPSSLQPGNAADLMPFTFDLTAHEIRRMTAVLEAMPDWDPATVLAAEVEAHSLLYSGLNAEQRFVYDLLCEEGVLDA